jgi:hypothetical protein
MAELASWVFWRSGLDDFAGSRALFSQSIRCAPALAGFWVDSSSFIEGLDRARSIR